MSRPSVVIDTIEGDTFTVQVERRGASGAGAVQFRIIERPSGATLLLNDEQFVDLLDTLDAVDEEWGNEP